MSDNVNLNNKETIENLLKNYKEENSELYQNVKDVVDENTKWENNGFGRDGNLLQLLILEYIDGNEEMVNQINDRIGKVRFGNVRPSYDFRIRKTIDVDGEEKEVSITSAFYKKYRYDNDIKAEVVPYTENDEEKCLLVIYDDGYTTDILENNEHKSYKLPGVNLDNIDEIKDVFFEQLDIALDREVHKEEVKEQEPEVIEETVEKVEEPKPVMTDADDVLLEGTAPEEEEKDHPVMTDGDDVLMEVPIADEDKKPVITDATDVLIEGGEVKEHKVEEESEVVESVDGVIEEAPEEIVEEEKEETVPVAKEDLPKERLEFISNDLKHASLKQYRIR